MSIKIYIRNVNVNDLETFVELYKLAYKGLEEYAYIKDKEIRYYFKWLLKRDERGFYIAEVVKPDSLHGIQPVGFVACDTNWISFFDNVEVGEIHELFVHPNWKRRGIGKKLLQYGIEYAINNKKDLIELWVGIKNYYAREFYRKNGFVEKGSWGKWIRMVKKIKEKTYNTFLKHFNLKY